MQTPAGFKIVGTGIEARAITTDFFQVVFNPSFLNRLFHTLAGAWQAGAFFVMSVCAWYLLKNRSLEFARAGMRLGLIVAALAEIAAAGGPGALTAIRRRRTARSRTVRYRGAA